MPYRVRDSNVEHYKNGKWTVKQKCSSPANAHAAIRLLRAIENNPNFVPKDRK
jgi:hypothetical protein